MSPHYSVYTVLQASRRSWRIGQTRPVKVYYFAYADTIQEQALYLVAAKVAAALRINGDTIADDSLAELDGITGNDIVATLARIVTGDTEVNTQSLQQAFAEANASLRQANTIIGEYEIVDDEGAEPLTACPEYFDKTSASIVGSLSTDSAQVAVNGNERLSSAIIRPEAGNGQVKNGVTRQPSLFTNGQTKVNGKVHLNDDAEEPEVRNRVKKPLHPPVPRPRLLI